MALKDENKLITKTRLGLVKSTKMPPIWKEKSWTTLLYKAILIIGVPKLPLAGGPVRVGLYSNFCTHVLVYLQPTFGRFNWKFAKMFPNSCFTKLGVSDFWISTWLKSYGFVCLRKAQAFKHQTLEWYKKETKQSWEIGDTLLKESFAMLNTLRR